jgi:SAM-dependent methyltransferase
MMLKKLARLIGEDRSRAILRKVGFDTTHWVRYVAYKECSKILNSLDPSRLDVLEVAPGLYWRSNFKFKSYSKVNLPSFDICRDTTDERFDLVIADQVLEHVADPFAAVRNLRAMLKEGGHLLLIVPFMLKLHDFPYDCTRWSEVGLIFLLEKAGFDRSLIRSGAWGNQRCVRANLRKGWRMYGWGRDIRNEKEFPVMVWAVAGNAARDLARR